MSVSEVSASGRIPQNANRNRVAAGSSLETGIAAPGISPRHPLLESGRPPGHERNVKICLALSQINPSTTTSPYPRVFTYMCWKTIAGQRSAREAAMNCEICKVIEALQLDGSAHDLWACTGNHRELERKSRHRVRYQPSRIVRRCRIGWKRIQQRYALSGSFGRHIHLRPRV